MSASDKLGLLEEEALKRKEKLKNLRKRALENNSEKEETDSVKPKFRSYKPQDESISENAKEQKITGDIEEQINDQLQLLKSPVVVEEIEITNLAPRKPDWDLKRDVSKKLEILERRTQKAIAELIRERLKKNEKNIFQIVNVETGLKNNINNPED